jgi:hypothetical protein
MVFCSTEADCLRRYDSGPSANSLICCSEWELLRQAGWHLEAYMLTFCRRRRNALRFV